jgi:hypothetical protein
MKDTRPPDISPPDGEPVDEVQVVLTFHPVNKNLEMTGPLADPVLMLSILEMAKMHLYARYTGGAGAPQGNIVLPTGVQLDPKMLRQ